MGKHNIYITTSSHEREICLECGLMGRKHIVYYKSKYREYTRIRYRHNLNNKSYYCYMPYTITELAPRKWKQHRKLVNLVCKINGCSTNFKSIKALREHKDKEHRI
jgi:hypothetical protein